MDVAADGHGAPHGRDVGLRGEDLTGHVAERLCCERRRRRREVRRERERERGVFSRSGKKENERCRRFLRSIAVEKFSPSKLKKKHLLSFFLPPLSSTTHLDLRLRQWAAPEQPLDLRVELRARRGVRQGWRGRHFEKFDGLRRSLSLDARSPLSIERRLSSFLRPSPLFARAVPRRGRRECVPPLCDLPQATSEREPPSWELRKRKKVEVCRRRWMGFLMFFVPPFLSSLSLSRAPARMRSSAVRASERGRERETLGKRRTERERELHALSRALLLEARERERERVERVKSKGESEFFFFLLHPPPPCSLYF